MGINNKSKFRIDYLKIDLIDDNFENEWSYIMGFDSGDDYTIPQEYIEKIDDEIEEKFENIRKICFPRIG